MQRHSFINSASNQLKFLVTGVSAAKQPVMVHVSRRRDRHSNRQPVLVLFNGDNGDSSSASATQSDVVHESISSSGEFKSMRQSSRSFIIAHYVKLITMCWRSAINRRFFQITLVRSKITFLKE